MRDVEPAPPIRSPFGAQSTALEVVAGRDLASKVALVTGASSGLGVETARALVSTGARVVLAVRSRERGEVALESLRANRRDADLVVAQVDLANLASIEEFTAWFHDHYNSLDILVNNAAVMATPQGVTSDGFELQFGTNHLGHFALTLGLTSALVAADGARVVALSSIGHRRSPVHFDDLFFERRPYDKWDAYGQSKTACALFAVGLDARYKDQGVRANAVHPGGIMTGLQQHLALDEQRAMGWVDEQGRVNARFKSVEQGAATSVWAAVGPELEGVGGRYLEDCGEAVPFDPASPMSGVMDYALDPRLADELWDRSLELVGA